MKNLRGSASRWLQYALGATAAATLAACGGGGGDGAALQGPLKVSLTDAPSCYENVFVTVEKVRVHKADSAGDGESGWEEIVPPNGPVKIDLLNLTNGEIADLGTAQVDVGSYTQMRLVLAENSTTDPLANSVKPIGGTLQPLKTPSAQQSGLKIRTDFAVSTTSTADMLLDFDACKSVVYAGNSGQYILKPVVRLGEKVAGSIQGYVTTTMTIGTSVSAQQDGQIVRSTMPDANGLFKLAYLPSGTYTVVITANERATGVISSVPVAGTATTTVNGTASYIVLPTSVMNTVTGVVTATKGSTTTLLGEATITATQAVSTGAVEVLSVPVDFDLATYTMKLPIADPVRAPYSAAGLAFAADSTAAGKYTLTATAPGQSPMAKTVDVRAAPTTTQNFAY
jgi:hypothetical protein